MVVIIVYNYDSYYYWHAYKTQPISSYAPWFLYCLNGYTEKAMLLLTLEQIISTYGPQFILLFLEKLALNLEG